MSLETIKDGDDVLAIIIRKEYGEPGLNFVTPESFNLQVGVHVRAAGDGIEPHVHNELQHMACMQVQEYIYLEKGRIRVSLFNIGGKVHSEVELRAGDCILLVCGHGMEFLEDVKMIEVKQGPYVDQHTDKTLLERDNKA